MISLLLEKAPEQHILVIGDLMLDAYMWGKAERISPEAPVPIVDVFKEEIRPGGAANVALNLVSLGAKVSLCGCVGTDFYGKELIQICENQGFNTEFIFPFENRRTTIKTRLIAGSQQVVRIDKEDKFSLETENTKKVLNALLPKIPDFQAIIFEDYDKGMITKELITAVVAEAKKYDIPVAIDPKFQHFFDYQEVTLFKPNLKELNEGLHLHLAKEDLSKICAAVLELRKKMPHSHTLITLSENGMIYIDEAGNFHHYPAHLRKIADVSGAGDTVISIIGLGLAIEVPFIKLIEIANIAGGLVCEEVGVVPIRRVQLESLVNE
jgi:rfaE bifunctional protein kinase chain/domain